METLLILLGVLGFGAIIISVHVFSAGQEIYDDDASEGATGAGVRERNGGNRRSGLEVVFPLLVNDTVVNEERRTLPERRQSVA